MTTRRLTEDFDPRDLPSSWNSFLMSLDHQDDSNKDLAHYEQILSMRVASECADFQDYMSNPRSLIQSVERITKDVYRSIPYDTLIQPDTDPVDQSPMIRDRLWNTSLRQIGHSRRYAYGIYVGKNLKTAIQQSFKVFPQMEDLVVINHLRTIYPNDLWGYDMSLKLFNSVCPRKVNPEFCNNVLEQYAKKNLLNLGTAPLDTLTKDNYQIYGKDGEAKGDLDVKKIGLGRKNYRNVSYQDLSDPIRGGRANNLLWFDGAETTEPIYYDEYPYRSRIRFTDDHHHGLKRFQNDWILNPLFQPNPVGIEFQNFKDVAVRLLVYPIDLREIKRTSILLWQDFSGAYYCDTNVPVSAETYDSFGLHADVYGSSNDPDKLVHNRTMVLTGNLPYARPRTDFNSNRYRRRLFRNFKFT
jgi:hypothetical protein